MYFFSTKFSALHLPDVVFLPIFTARKETIHSTIQILRFQKVAATTLKRIYQFWADLPVCSKVSRVLRCYQITNGRCP